MITKRRCHVLLSIWLIGAAANLITGCGSSTYDRLDLTLTVDTFSGQQAYTKSHDATAALLYYHIIEAHKPAPGYLSCPSPKVMFTYHFSQAGRRLLDVHSTNCYLLILSDHTSRLPDAQLWDLTNQFTGQDVAPR